MGKYNIIITNHPNVTRDNQILMWIETEHFNGTKECYQDYPLEKQCPNDMCTQNCLSFVKHQIVEVINLFESTFYLFRKLFTCRHKFTYKWHFLWCSTWFTTNQMLFFSHTSTTPTCHIILKIFTSCMKSK
jgi:hypothetical protein